MVTTTQNTNNLSALSTIQAQVEEARKRVEQLGKDFQSITPTSKNINFVNAANEITQSSPTLEPDVGGAMTTAAGLEATVPSQQMLLDEIKKFQEQSAKQSEGLRTLLQEKPRTLNIEDITKQAFASLGLPADFAKTQFESLQKTNAEILSLTQQINDLNTQEQNSLTRVESQQIPMENIQGQQRQVQRDFAIKKSGVAAEVQAKAAYAESLRGNFTLVNQLVEKAVSLATYQKQQEIADWKWMFDNYKDEFDSFTQRERNLYDDLINSLETEEKETRQDLKDKMKLYIDNNVPIPNMQTLQNQSFEEAATYVSQNKPVDTTGVNAPLNVLDIARYQELYPDAGVTAGDTQTTANAKVQALNAPKTYTSTQLNQIAQANKQQKVPYEQALAGIQSDSTILNKEEAISVLDEVYGKKPKPKGPPATLRGTARNVNTFVQSFGEGFSTGASNLINSLGSFLFGK